MNLHLVKGIKFSPFADEFVNMLLPCRCGMCNRPLVRSERTLCTLCLFRLPRSHSHLWPCSLIEEKLFGRLPVSPAYSFLVYSRKGMTRELLHHIKYEGRKELARGMGRLYGNELLVTGCRPDADFLIPVPVHWRRSWKRGYNQAECFAFGLSETLRIPVRSDILRRRFNRTSQTEKSRYQRWERMDGQFRISPGKDIAGRNVLLVDDVITTGSTLDSCARELNRAGARSVGILTLAVVK